MQDCKSRRTRTAFPTGFVGCANNSQTLDRVQNEAGTNRKVSGQCPPSSYSGIIRYCFFTTFVAMTVTNEMASAKDAIVMMTKPA